MVLSGAAILPSLVRPERAPTRHQTQNPGHGEKPPHPGFVTGEKWCATQALKLWFGWPDKLPTRHAGRVHTHAHSLNAVLDTKAAEKSQYVRVHFNHPRRKLRGMVTAAINAHKPVSHPDTPRRW